MNSQRLSEILIGTLFLLATLSYMSGDSLVQPLLSSSDYLQTLYPKRSEATVGVLLMLLTALSNVTIGVMLFPILKRYNETVALFYVVGRIFDGAGIVVIAVVTLAQVAISQVVTQNSGAAGADMVALSNLLSMTSHNVFRVTMMLLAIASIPFCALLYQSKLIPRAISVLGILGYVSLLIGSALELFQINPNMMHYVLGGLFEAILPIWLFVKGFNLATKVTPAPL